MSLLILCCQRSAYWHWWPLKYSIRQAQCLVADHQSLPHVRYTHHSQNCECSAILTPTPLYSPTWLVCSLLFVAVTQLLASVSLPAIGSAAAGTVPSLASASMPVMFWRCKTYALTGPRQSHLLDVKLRCGSVTSTYHLHQRCSFERDCRRCHTRRPPRPPSRTPWLLPCWGPYLRPPRHTCPQPPLPSDEESMTLTTYRLLLSKKCCPA